MFVHTAYRKCHRRRPSEGLEVAISTKINLGEPSSKWRLTRSVQYISYPPAVFLWEVKSQQASKWKRNIVRLAWSRPTPSSRIANRSSTLLLLSTDVSPTFHPFNQPKMFLSGHFTHISTYHFRLFRLLLLAFSFLLGASTIIKVTDLAAIKNILLESFINFIMHVTCPRRSARAGRHLWWELGQDSAEVGGTFAARIEASKKVDVWKQCGLLVLRRFIWEFGHGRM